jgi:hypothetical protein
MLFNPRDDHKIIELLTKLSKQNTDLTDRVALVEKSLGIITPPRRHRHHRRKMKKKMAQMQ